jgi:hypothetical protein
MIRSRICPLSGTKPLPHQEQIPGVISGTVWSYWPVYIGAGLTLMVVTMGLTIAVHHLKAGEPIHEHAITMAPEEPVRPATPQAAEPGLVVSLPLATIKTAPPDMEPGFVARAKLVPPDVLHAKKRHPAIKPMVVTAAREKLETANEIKQQSPADIHAAVAPQPQKAAACGNNGTCVRFVTSPDAAARQALAEDKLVFIIHVSGNFEDPRFT